MVPLTGGTEALYVNGALSGYLVPDWLGNMRIGASPARAYKFSQAFAPFGETYATGGSVAVNTFTGKNNDTIVDMFDFPARNLHSSQGRWVSPDPAGLAAVEPSNPQSWNRYAYVTNNPLALVDLLGLEGCPDRPDDPFCFKTTTPPPPPTDPTALPPPSDPLAGAGLCDHPACNIGAYNFISLALYCDTHPCGRGTAANNGPQQQIGPAPQPPDTHTHKYSDYLACAFGTEINDMFGDKNKAATTVLINIAPLAPANYLKGGPIPYLIVAGVWEIGHALKARSECTASVYGR